MLGGEEKISRIASEYSGANLIVSAHAYGIICSGLIRMATCTVEEVWYETLLNARTKYPNHADMSPTSVMSDSFSGIIEMAAQAAHNFTLIDFTMPFVSFFQLNF